MSRTASKKTRDRDAASPSLTLRQAEVLAYLREHIRERGFAPTTEELSEACRLGSPSGAHRMLKTLERKGHLRREPGRSRAIVLQEPVAGLAGADTEELYMLSLITELQGAARDAVLRMAADVEDASIKASLIRDAAERHELVSALGEQLQASLHRPPSSRGALRSLLGALRADSSWPEFLVDHLVFNEGSRTGVQDFRTDHAAVQHHMLRVAAVAGRAAAEAREWLGAELKHITDDERSRLRQHARTMLQVQALTARLIEQEAQDEGLFEPPMESVLPELLR